MMRTGDFRPNMRVVVVRNEVGAHTQRRGQGDGYLLHPGDEIKLHSVVGNDFRYTTLDGGYNTIPAKDVRPAGPRVKQSPKIDIWEAARGYIRS